MSAAEMTAPGPIQVPVVFIRFIGVCEILGAVGMILPVLTSIRPGLTPLGAGGLVIIMIGATVINIVNGMAAFAMPTAVLGLMAAYVVWGRWWSARTQIEKRKTKKERIMRFLCLYKPGQESTGAPTQQEIDAMGALIGEMSEAGVLVQTEGCQPSSKGARVRINGGQFTVVDGPFAEAKELVGGMAVIQVQSKAEAIEWTKRFLTVAGRGESEIRQLHEMPAPD